MILRLGWFQIHAHFHWADFGLGVHVVWRGEISVTVGFFSITVEPA